MLGGCFADGQGHLPYTLGGLQHIFREDGVAFGGVVDKHVGDGTGEFSVLNNRRAAHECVNIGPTNPHAKTLENRRKGNSLAAVLTHLFRHAAGGKKAGHREYYFGLFVLICY